MFKPRQGWGPDGKRAALAITFDNLGEAGWLERDMWTGPIGEHYTAPFVPKLVETLGDVRATYFMEASNAEIYPEAIKFWRNSGQEVGVHGWRHEDWAKTEPERRRDILKRSMVAMRTIGVEPVGFRPPGGEVSGETFAELEEAGFHYCSDVSEAGITRIGGILSIPFEWPNVDAYNLESLAAPLRSLRGDPQEDRTIDEWKQLLDQSLQQTIARGGLRTVLFHPEFIALSEDKLAVLPWLIERARAADMWIAPLHEIARFAAAQMEPIPA